MLAPRPILVEGVAGVDVIAAVDRSHLLDEHLADLEEERVRRVHHHHAAVLLSESAPVAVAGELCFREQAFHSLGHTPSKGREHRQHSQLSLPREDLELEISLLIYPGLREAPSPGLDVDHPVPGKEGRAREVGGHLLVCESEPPEDALRDILLASQGEGKVDAAHCHPVDLSLPPLPVPPSLRVREGADVLVVSPLHQALLHDRPANPRELAGQHQGKL
mmetsp:Transcript_2150/g.6554  ORF Transcript_2150/g.6554 Transcript_2150/m.6554 type:complete len:220 (-) Transcript_2150:549-1208(-)